MARGGWERPPAWAWIAMAVSALALVVMLPMVVQLQAATAAAATRAEAAVPGTPSASRPRVAFLGDSYTAGSPQDSGELARWPGLVSASRGWEPLYFAVGGSGFTTAGPQAGADRFVDRIPRIGQARPDLVIVAGGANDANASPQGFRAAVKEVLSGLATQLPGAQIVVLSPFWRAEPTPPVAVERTILSEEAQATHATFIDVSDLFDHPEGLIGADGVHPTDAGHQHIADVLESTLPRLP